ARIPVDFFGSDLVLRLAALALLLLAAVGASAWLARRPLRQEIERLKDDVHALLARRDGQRRLVLNGRPSEFVDIAASVNRLLDREQEGAPEEPAVGPLFDVLADTLPDIAVVHTQTIQYANRPAGELFGVGS